MKKNIYLLMTLAILFSCFKIQAQTNVTTTGGTPNYIPIFDGTTSVINSDLLYTSGGSAGEFDFGTNYIKLHEHLVYNSYNGYINWSGEEEGNLYFRTLSTMGDISTYTDVVTILYNGYVGIGTTNPKHKLVVNGSELITGDGSGLLFGDALTPDWGEYGIEYMDQGLNFWKPYGNSYDGQTTNYIMFLKDDGNVGIGVDPDDINHKLVVDGSAFITGDGSSLLFGDNLTPEWGEYGIEYMEEGLNIWKPYGNSYDGQTTNYIMFFKDDGNVGIGVDPGDIAYKLDVAGTIRACEVIVETTNCPDYVFEEDYDLMTIDEVHSYIKEHKHLPEVPSAKIMEADGANLGEMNKILLKKIEELTLYIIELKKENEQIKEVLDKNNLVK